MSLFDRCAECKECCKSIDSYLHIHVFAHETELKNMLARSGMGTTSIVIAPGEICRFMGPHGCILGDIRPFHCRFYPLFLLPGDAIGIDPGCRNSKEYIAQLGDPSSDASLHLKNSKDRISKMPISEKAALCEWSHYACDVDVVDNDTTGSGH
jgi:hypothetical protein